MSSKSRKLIRRVTIKIFAPGKRRLPAADHFSRRRQNVHRRWYSEAFRGYGPGNRTPHTRIRLRARGNPAISHFQFHLPRGTAHGGGRSECLEGPGRRPKPTALKKLQGNPGKRKLNEAEPKIAQADPVMPRDLSKPAAQEWRRIVPELRQMGVLSTVDRAALAAYCHAYERWFDAEKDVRRYGRIVREPILHQGVRTGYIRLKKNPAVTISETATKIMKAFLCEFGMTPSSRSRVRIDKPAVGDEDPIDAFLKGASATNKHVN